MLLRARKHQATKFIWEATRGAQYVSGLGKHSAPQDFLSNSGDSTHLKMAADGAWLRAACLQQKPETTNLNTKQTGTTTTPIKKEVAVERLCFPAAKPRTNAPAGESLS